MEDQVRGAWTEDGCSRFKESLIAREFEAVTTPSRAGTDISGVNGTPVMFYQANVYCIVTAAMLAGMAKDGYEFVGINGTGDVPRGICQIRFMGAEE
ncbi:MAG: hypothetical protein MPK62_01515 [Alphaproteobacteria bacterium]|nr:hypothetical protein [Alphaproteobacteria bacterium]MDA8029812.1 hypothetical protein [Alphaproteobacteria bacterium]